MGASDFQRDDAYSFGVVEKVYLMSRNSFYDAD